MAGVFNILVLDRNKNVREFLRREFDRLGYEVELIQDDSELAARLLDGRSPNLVIMDLMLWSEDGLSLLTELHETFAETPVIVYSSMSECEQESLDRGAAAFVDKQGEIKGLLAAVSFWAQGLKREA